MDKKDILVLFDIDGTILKMKQYHSKSIFNKCFHDLFNIDVPEDKMPNFSGMTDLSILEEIALAGGISIDAVLSRTEEIWDYLIAEFKEESVLSNLVLLPEIKELIDTLNRDDRVSLGLLTGNFKANAYLKLSRFKLDSYFPIGAFGCDEADRNLLFPLAIKRAKSHWNKLFTAGRTIIIGDSPRDIECAKENAAISVAVCTGFHTINQLQPSNPDYIFSDFEQHEGKISEILDNIN